MTLYIIKGPYVPNEDEAAWYWTRREAVDAARQAIADELEHVKTEFDAVTTYNEEGRKHTVFPPSIARVNATLNKETALRILNNDAWADEWTWGTYSLPRLPKWAQYFKERETT